MVFFTSEPGLRTANGPTMTTTTLTATAANRHATRLPSRTKSSANAITRAGQAVAFIEQATPKARAAGTGLVTWSRQSSAKPRHMNATMGTSVPPTHSSNEMIGEAVSSSAQRTLSLAPAIRSATAKVARNTHAEPDPGIGEDAVTEQRLRHAEHRHQRQVRVIRVGVGRGGQRLRAAVGGAVLDKLLRGGGHHADLRFPVAVRDQPEQREQDRAARHHGQRHVDAAGSPGPPGHDRERGQRVPADRGLAPQPVPRIGAEQRDPAGEQGRGEEARRIARPRAW